MIRCPLQSPGGIGITPAGGDTCKDWGWDEGVPSS